VYILQTRRARYVNNIWLFEGNQLDFAQAKRQMSDSASLTRERCQQYQWKHLTGCWLLAGKLRKGNGLACRYCAHMIEECLGAISGKESWVFGADSY